MLIDLFIYLIICLLFSKENGQFIYCNNYISSAVFYFFKSLIFSHDVKSNAAPEKKCVSQSAEQMQTEIGMLFFSHSYKRAREMLV